MVWILPYGEYCENQRGNHVVVLDEDDDVVCETETLGQALHGPAQTARHVVVVCPGRYRESIQGFSDPNLLSDPFDLEIVAPGGPDVTVLDADGTGNHAFSFHLQNTFRPQAFTLRGLGVTGSSADGLHLTGAASSGTLVVLDQVEVYGNSNGVYVEGDARVTDSVVMSNVGLGMFARHLDLDGTTVSYNGSGLQVQEVVGGTVERNFSVGALVSGGARGTIVRDNQGTGILGSGVLTDVWVEGNHAKDGGGLRTNLSSDWFDLRGNTVVTGNHADRDGGGVWGNVRGTGLQAIVENTATRGGGVFVPVRFGQPEPSSTTGVWVARNVASADGGGLFVDGLADVADVTVADNLATRGGGLFVDAGAHASPEVTLTRLDVYGNGAREGGGLGIRGVIPVELTKSWISGNSADIGGGIWMSGGGALTPQQLVLSGGHVTANVASTGGGLALVGHPGQIWSEWVDWGAAKSSGDNVPVDIDVNGAAWDGDGWDLFGCDSTSCVEVFPIVAP